jgi:hypothetical protein
MPRNSKRDRSAFRRRFPRLAVDIPVLPIGAPRRSRALTAFFLAASNILHQCGARRGRPIPAPPRQRHFEERYRLKRIRIVDLLEGKTAVVLAVVLFVVIVVIFAYAVFQTA